MGINLVNGGGSTGGGGFLKPQDFVSATLIIFEPKKSQESQYRDQDGNVKLNAIGDFTFFYSDAELEQGKPQSVKEDAVFSSGVLAKVLIENIGNTMVGTLVQTEGKGGRQGYWKIQPVSEKQTELAVAYLEKREAEREEALPDFLKN